MKSIKFSLHTSRWLYVLAAVSLLTTLPLPYVGEEAVYTITSLEMRVNGDFFVTTLYGNSYGRPPLLSWLVIALSEVLGWDRVLTASRLVTAAATLATGLVVAWLAFNITQNRTFAALSALIYLSGDTLFYRGWLAYSDSLFTFFVFAAIACLWVGTLRKRGLFVWLAVIAVTCGFLTKVQTAYLFYGVALLILGLDGERRRFLLSANSIVAHLAAAGVLLLWHTQLTHGTQSASTFTDIALKLKTVDLGDYLLQVTTFPFETVLRFLPASAVALYFWWRKPAAGSVEALPAFPWRALAAILLLNYLPYWLGPKSHIRYIMPLYPLAALLLAALIWRLDERARTITFYWLAAAVAFRFVFGLALMPWYQQQYRGDYAATAAQIADVTKGVPLYATDVSATGLSVTAQLDVMRYPQSYVRWPPAQWDHGFVLAYEANAKLGAVHSSYPLGRNTLYLLCRGTACEVPKGSATAQKR